MRDYVSPLSRITFMYRIDDRSALTLAKSKHTHGGVNRECRLHHAFFALKAFSWRYPLHRALAPNSFKYPRIRRTMPRTPSQGYLSVSGPLPLAPPLILAALMQGASELMTAPSPKEKLPSPQEILSAWIGRMVSVMPCPTAEVSRLVFLLKAIDWVA